MPDDPDESFVINTLLKHRVGGSVPPVRASDGHVPVLAPGDDAALVDPSQAVTVDTMVEGVHWDDLLSPQDVGWKLVASNASDINAMGGTPTWAVLSVALPKPLDREWVSAFAQGLCQAMTKWNIALVGGDTTRGGGPKVLSLTVGGEVQKPVGRSFATPGQTIWVSGPLGGPAAGFLMEPKDEAALLSLRRPDPPIGLGLALSQSEYLGAMMDVSDGLARDLGRLCKASEVGAQVHPDALPAHPAITEHSNAIALMTGFGEEYELLFTADPSGQHEIEAICGAYGRRATPIGQTNQDRESGPVLLGQDWPPLLFSHFSGTA